MSNIAGIINKLIYFIVVSSIFAIIYSNLHAYSKQQSIEGFNYIGTFDPWYYSFMVSSTVGFGDITPVSKLARGLAIVQVLTIWIARDSEIYDNITIGLVVLCMFCIIFYSRLIFW